MFKIKFTSYYLVITGKDVVIMGKYVVITRKDLGITRKICRKYEKIMPQRGVSERELRALMF